MLLSETDWLLLMKFSAKPVPKASMNGLKKRRLNGGFQQPFRVVCFLAFSALACPGSAQQRIETIARIKPSVVAIATFQKTRAPSIKFIGTGFVVGDGSSVITNAHVVTAVGRDDANEVLGVIAGTSDSSSFREAKLLGSESQYDLAHLKINGPALPALSIGDSNTVKEGSGLLITGFPIGMVLGFHHVTHQTMISAITPIAIPAMRAGALDARAVATLRDEAYHVFQLDGTAYPGNSGSPLYDPETGEVFGVVNKVFVKGTKESALSQPSGITYAIPSRFILKFLDGNKTSAAEESASSDRR